MKRIYIDYDIFYTDRERFADACRKVAGSEASLYIGLPYILAEEKHNRLCELLDYVNSNMKSMVKGFLVRNLEELGLLAARRVLRLQLSQKELLQRHLQSLYMHLQMQMYLRLMLSQAKHMAALM